MKLERKLLKIWFGTIQGQCLLCTEYMCFSSYWELSDAIGWTLKGDNPQDHLSNFEGEMSLKIGHLPEHSGTFKNPSQSVY